MAQRLLRYIKVGVIVVFISSDLVAQNVRYIDSTNFSSQKDIIDVFRELKIFNQHVEEKPDRLNKKLRLSVLPTVSPAQGATGLVFVTAFTATFLLGDPQTTNASNIYFIPYTNFDGKFVFPIRSYIWTKNNKWNFIGDYKYLIYPETTYGLGSGSNKNEASLVNYKHFRFYQSVLRNVFSYLVMGGGVHFDHHYDIQEELLNEKYNHVLQYDGAGITATQSNGLSFTSAFDSRLNSLNPQQGMYAGVMYKYIPTWMGSTSNWKSLYADIKLYHSFNRKRQNIISFWSFYWDVFAGKAPYLDLPSTAWDPSYRSGRGYYQGRFRGDAMAYIESEYRFDLTQNGLWGATVFANAQSLRNPSTRNFEKIAPGVGAGLRLKFNKFSNTNLTFDVAVGSESWNYYFGIGEFF
jgi:hypothetical protein